MMKISLMLMILFSTLMPYVFNPLMLTMFILMQTILLTILTRLLSKSSWLPLTIFMVIIGGLMVLFIYMTSICSNVKYNYVNIKKALIYSTLIWNLINPVKQLFNLNDSLQMMDTFNKEMFKIFLPSNIPCSISIFLYLFLMLIIMINIMKYEKGPMRKKY
uniref:NADH dehydrogenase subunit 6 n=1 Tax=Melanastera paucipunctata TaxID=2218046 RepID=A0A344A2A2_9HEMI|nr:NADH dehydrogenase subunit 6 [Diclidophlebia paucipunctata]AWU48893.1 NADH dehydrogenase subunit 6 [Diclidophlebia paucipunctata]